MQTARAIGNGGCSARKAEYQENAAAFRRGSGALAGEDEASTCGKGDRITDTASRVTSKSDPDRVARVTALVWTPADAPAQNLFTLVRTRRRDAAGPWAGAPDEAWCSQNLDDDVRLLRLDTTDEECRDIIRRILQSGSLATDELKIHYALDPAPHLHRAYRDHMGGAERAMFSPFQNHSAAITEYWSFGEAPLQWWLDLSSPPSYRLKHVLKRLGFPLESSCDRVGNLLIARAEDAFTARLNFDRGHKVLRFLLNTPSPQKMTCRTMVWAGFSGNELLRREVPFVVGQTEIKTDSDIDHIGFAIYDTSSGDCVDLMNVGLIMDVSVNIQMQSGPTLQLQTKKKKTPIYSHAPRIRSIVDVRGDHGESGRDKKIRDKWLRRLHHNREVSARQRRVLGRFSAEERGEAAGYFLEILRRDADSKTPIYIADPYFLPVKRDPFLENLYLRIFGETAGQPLRVLCGKLGSEDARRWWCSLPRQVIGHVSVRSFVRRADDKPCFHDRYVVTPTREIIVTNSFNGWSTHGVTVADLPSEVYRSEANKLWAREVGSTDTEVLVTEIT